MVLPSITSSILTGTVISGKGRGRKIGFPTANVDIGRKVRKSEAGVFAATINWNCSESTFGAVVNVGVRPTFVDRDSTLSGITIEAHVLDFSGDLYGKVVTIQMLKKLREEQRFFEVEALCRQLSIDVEHTRGIIGKFSTTPIRIFAE